MKMPYIYEKWNRSWCNLSFPENSIQESGIAQSKHLFVFLTHNLKHIVQIAPSLGIEAFKHSKVTSSSQLFLWLLLVWPTV